MLEGPVLLEIIPPVVLKFPTVMTESAHLVGGKCLRVQGGKPEPFVGGGFGLELALTVMIMGERLFGSNDTYGVRVVERKRGSPRVSDNTPVFQVACLIR
jgi:hypothetical protein